MEMPKDPQAFINFAVFSNRDSDRRSGRVVSIGADSDRPIILWSGNRKPIVCEWRHIELSKNGLGMVGLEPKQ